MIRANEVSLGGMKLTINADSTRGCYQEVLAALKREMDAMLSHYSRVLFVRLDIRQREYCGDNAPMSDFCRKLKKHLSRRYKTTRIGYLWVRELEKAKQQHYHLVLMLDGHKVRHPSRLIRRVEAITEGWDWPRPYTPKNCYYWLERGNQEAYATAFYRGSYLAKERGKGHKATTANNYGRSAVRACAD
ncbi:YagK/YfjJ domain-containing protein [Alcanivorax sp.]|uniref:YagK/YfjJ domain-containing protein n=1 Tax=Alcanivorax sp. TaxID=1872427 RepID=UPI003C6F45EA